uniref:Uncharacterized protein n=1 Tax=Arundo donax TaxID=35708 RepID=A0A0A9GWR4_ARUDO
MLWVHFEIIDSYVRELFYNRINSRQSLLTKGN